MHLVKHQRILNNMNARKLCIEKLKRQQPLLVITRGLSFQLSTLFLSYVNHENSNTITMIGNTVGFVTSALEFL